MTEPSHTTRSAAEMRQSLEKRHLRWHITKIVADPEQPRREFSDASLAELAANLVAVGQLCPIIGYLDAADSTRLILVDGERRLRAARRTNLEFLDVIVLPERPNQDQLLLAQLSINHFREDLTNEEQCAAYTQLLTSLGITQTELAARLGVSPSKINKALAHSRLVPELQPLANQLEATVVPLIAKLPDEQQHEAMTFATTANEAGRRPTREQIAAFIKAKFECKPTTRAKTLAGTWQDRTVRIGLKPDDTHDSLIESMKAFINFVHRNRNVPVPNLDLVLSK